MAVAGAGLLDVLSRLSFVPKQETGAISVAGAPNVFINMLPAIRAHLDSATCKKHSAPAIIATGSATVFINGEPAARRGDKTICSAIITAGADNVFIGGGTAQTDLIHPEGLVPEGVHQALFIVGLGTALVLAPLPVAVGALVLAMGGGYGGNWLGGKIFGEGSDGQIVMALCGTFLGGMLGTRAGKTWVRPKPKAPIYSSELTGGQAGGTIIKKDFTIESNKFDYFHGKIEAPPMDLKGSNPKRYAQLEHNYRRSQQLKKVLDATTS